MRAALALSSLLALCAGCSAVDPGEVMLPATVRCGPVEQIPIRTQRLNPADCWRLVAPSGFGVSEVDGDCENAPACLVTPANVFWRVDLNYSGQDAPVRWTEVACSERC